jgi:hypothetical protein
MSAFKLENWILAQIPFKIATGSAFATELNR